MLQLQAQPLVADTLDQNIRSLLKLSKVCRHAKRKILFNQGESCGTVYIILQGWVRLFTITEEGQEPIIDLMTRGSILGFDTFVHANGATYSAEVVSDEVTVLEVPVIMLQENIQLNAAIGNYFVTMFAAQILRLQQHIERISFVPAQQRVTSFLLSLCEGSGRPFALPCEKSLIASYLGMKRETFSRVLSQLKQYGVRVDGTIVTISDIAKLQRLNMNSAATSLPYAA
ncbi:MAG: Crp/Fnr family transcriptional regulator [Rickettsiales bacterium]